MTIDINTEAEEVIRLAESGALLRDPRPEMLGDVVVTHSLDDLQAWLFTEARPGVRVEDALDWLGLRENMAGDIHGDAYRRSLDATAQRDLNRRISRRIDAALAERLPQEFAEYSEDISADLVHCALVRALGSRGNHALLFERIFEAYKAGVFPCGWEGRFPVGRLAVFAPASEGVVDE